jgi:hypothetical protein
MYRIANCNCSRNISSRRAVVGEASGSGKVACVVSGIVANCRIPYSKYPVQHHAQVK